MGPLAGFVLHPAHSVAVMLPLCTPSNTQPVMSNPKSGSQNIIPDDRFRLLVENIKDYAVYMLTLDGIVASWNAGAQRFKGYTADEIIGKSFAQFYSAEDQAAGLP